MSAKISISCSRVTGRKPCSSDVQPLWKKIEKFYTFVSICSSSNVQSHPSSQELLVIQMTLRAYKQFKQALLF